MKKKFTSSLKEKKGLPLSIYFLDKNDSKPTGTVLKYEKARKLNADGYELFGFYKVISKF